MSKMCSTHIMKIKNYYSSSKKGEQVVLEGEEEILT